MIQNPLAPAGPPVQALKDLAGRLRGLASGLRAQGIKTLDPLALASLLEEAAGLMDPRPAAALAPEPPAPPVPPARTAALGPMLLHADGGSRGNPGPAGAGAALLDAQGAPVAQWHRYLGVATNNVAEYQALLMGLRGALELGVQSLEVRLDSELLVRQMQGRYQVKSPHLKPLYQEAKDLAARFGSLVFRHVPRAQNAIADRLANLAMDQG